MNKLQVKVIRKQKEAENIFSFELESLDGRPLPAFAAGAHIDVFLKNGITRQYSLCGDPASSGPYMIAVLKDTASRGGSIAMHDTLHEGDIVDIGVPRNLFALAPHQGKSLLFAGGIGVTPILSMARQLYRSGADFSLHYCTRSETHAAFRQQISASAFADRVAFHFDDGDVTQKFDLPAVLRAAAADTHLYVCGPAGFIAYVVDTARSLQWSDRQVHVEHFGAAPMPAAMTQGEGKQAEREFDVKINSTGTVYRIPADLSITAALAREGVEIPVSCEQGVCGTCITRIITGTPDHRDCYFTLEEQQQGDQFTPCCSRALSDVLVLDL